MTGHPVVRIRSIGFCRGDSSSLLILPSPRLSSTQADPPDGDGPGQTADGGPVGHVGRRGGEHLELRAHEAYEVGEVGLVDRGVERETLSAMLASSGHHRAARRYANLLISVSRHCLPFIALYGRSKGGL